MLGKFLVRKQGRKEIACMITEVEGYDGHKDKASHAHRGETMRNKVMFGEAGIWYVYFVYGMYDMLNVVTGQHGYPAAILIRGVEDIRGPGRLTKKLGVTRRLNGRDATRTSGLWIEDRGINVKKKDITRAARIGVNYAGPVWSKKPYRFILKKHHEN
ncbi:MAG: DNA-3-methyladenine glycosylase [Candidatus Yonathbacteria bacterium]|nr:DNA-3-methyladenine glycosylase [Candidatus Yonathbacteria bacterium]